MDTFSVRGARSLAIILLALLLHGDAASTHPGLVQDAEADDERLLDGTPWANETDPWAAVYEHTGWLLSWTCPRREKNGTLPRITRLCYAREIRLREKLFRPPPPQESPEQEARRRVVEILTTSSVQVDPWPEIILNPVMDSMYRTYSAPPFQPAARHAPI